jgi:phosphohistidine phosphatase
MLMNEARQLLLLRHADAAPGSPSLDDFDRPLTARGQRQATFLAARLKTVPIDYVLCSAAVRARETVNPILRGCCSTSMPTVVYDKTAYGADARTLLEIFATVPPTAKSVMLVGHNPALEDLLEILAPTGGSLPGGFPKGACVHLATNAPWESLASQATRVAGFYRGEAEQTAAFAC